MKHVVMLASALALSGCVVGPTYQTPDVPLEQRFAFAGGPELRDAASDKWWTALGDPVLNAFMHEGLDSNLDIMTAQARIKESEALARATGVLEQQVQGNLEAQASKTRADGQTISNESTTLNGAFDFDLFGRADRIRERARANLEASTLDAAQTRLAYQAELADAVIQARFFQAASRATERTISNRRRILSNTEELLEKGQATRNDRLRAQAGLAQAQANLPDFRQGLRTNAVRIAVLLDKPSAPVLHSLKQAGHGQPAPRRKFSAGQPADLLRNRPDVAAAERRLAASYAALGVAYADLYPTLSVTGTIRADGTDSLTFGPTLTVPVFNRWNLLAQRDAAEARVEQAALDRRSLLRSAVGDVEQALIQIESAEEEIVSLRRARDNFRNLFDLSQETFRIGETTLLELLDSEQEIESAEIALAASRRDLAQGVALLAVATGRGADAGLSAATPETSDERVDETAPGTEAETASQMASDMDTVQSTLGLY